MFFYMPCVVRLAVLPCLSAIVYLPIWSQKAEGMLEISALELYSGIGGFHFAFKKCGLPGNVCIAMDINTLANDTYKYNFPESLSFSVDDIEKNNINLLWMSPPCQPFTRVGKEMDCFDPRTKSFLHVIDILSRLKKKPMYIALENVKGFEISQTRNAFVTMLEKNGYEFQEFLLTPSQFSIPNSRLRYYAVAKLKPLRFIFQTTRQLMTCLPEECHCDVSGCQVKSVGTFLEAQCDEHFEEFLLSDDILKKYYPALDIVDCDSKASCCFTKGYTHFSKGTGSVLHVHRQVELPDAEGMLSKSDKDQLATLRALGLRYFTPGEIANLLGFPKQFGFPSGVSRRQQYRLLGNSLNVDVVSRILRICLEEP